MFDKYDIKAFLGCLITINAMAVCVFVWAYLLKDLGMIKCY